MPDHERAFAELMQSLLAQTPDRPHGPPKGEDRHEDFVLQSILGMPEKAPAFTANGSLTAGTSHSIGAFATAVARFRKQERGV